jgi:toxin ParE1/3/4
VAFRLAGRTEVRLTRIILESARKFGFDAADQYDRLMFATFAAIGDNPLHPASVDLAKLPGVRVFPLHLGRRLVPPEFRVKQPRHIVVYRLAPDGLVEVIGLAHDRVMLDRAARRMQREAGAG